MSLISDTDLPDDTIKSSLPKDIINKIKKNILNNNNYKFVSDPPMSLKLSDQVIIYNIDDQWKIIPLIISLIYPIIYDSGYTIVVCPLTLRSVVFKGTFILHDYQENRMILKEPINEDALVAIDLGYKIDKQYLIESNRRSEVKISTLRCALMFAPDSLFLEVTHKFSPNNTIINIDYYSNLNDLSHNKIDSLIHPKTLVYIVQYKSFVTGEDKVSILLGKDANKETITGYDVRKSGLFDYLNKYKRKIINKKGYTIPMFWYMAKNSYKISKIVYIS